MENGRYTLKVKSYKGVDFRGTICRILDCHEDVIYMGIWGEYCSVEHARRYHEDELEKIEDKAEYEADLSKAIEEYCAQYD